MRLTWQPLTLQLKTPFRIAHGSSAQRHNVIVHLDEGIGEAAAVFYHGETQAGIIDYLVSAASLLSNSNPLLVEDACQVAPLGSAAARAGIDMAIHDLWGKRLGQPLYRLLGLNPDSAPLTSFTIGMDSPEEMGRRASESNMPIIKIKVGGENDEAIVRAIREATPAPARRRQWRLDSQPGANVNSPPGGVWPGVGGATTTGGRHQRLAMVVRAELGRSDIRR